MTVVRYVLVPLLLVAALATEGLAAQRVMVLLKESRDGMTTPQRMGEVKLTALLTAAGVKVTEAVETHEARSRIAINKVMGGKVDGAVTSLNTDILIVGTIDTVKEDIPNAGIQAHFKAASARWAMKAIDVARGVVLASETARTSATGTNPLTASDAARIKAATKMFGALKTVVKGSTSKVGLHISGVPGMEAVNTLKKTLMAAKGIEKVDVEFVSGNVTKLDLTVKGLSAYDLASTLKRVSNGRLAVKTLSRTAIHATFKPAGRRIVVARFENVTGQKRHDWLGSTLPEVFETEMYNSKYLSVALPKKGKRPQLAARAEPAAAKAAAKASGTDLVVAGKLEQTGAKYRLALAVYRADTGAPVVAANQFATEPELIDVTKQLVWDVDKRLFETLFKRKDLGEYRGVFGSPAAGSSTAAAGGNPSGGPKLRVLGVDMANIYPARLSLYANRPFGQVRVQNPGKTPMANVRLRVSIPTVADAPSVIRSRDIMPGATATIPITMVLDRMRVLGITQNTPARADIVLSYDNGKGEVSDAFTQSLVIFDKNAIDWGVPESMAAFVTHKAPAMETFAASALRSGVSVPKTFPRALHTSMLLFEAMASLPIRYVKDAENPYGKSPVDSVAYPQETLNRKAGDCDDLSALYASLLHSQGNQALFVLTPGHIFVAADTGVSMAKAKARLGLDPKGLIERYGTAWVPVEVTKVGASFAEAVLAGMAEVGRHRGTKPYGEVEITKAWRSFAPFAGLPSKAQVKADQGALQARVDAGAAKMKAAEASAGADVGATPKPDTVSKLGELNAIGVRLAERGMVDEAGRYFRKGVQRDPERGDVQYNLANIKVIEKQYAKAELIYRRLEADKKMRKQARHGLGVVNYLQGRRKTATKMLGKAKLPESKRLLKVLGLAKKKPKKPKQPKASGKKRRDAFGGRFIGVRASGGVDVESMLVWVK